MKKVYMTLVLLSALLISLIISASVAKISDDPKISLNLTVSDLTDKEYESVGTKGIENASKSDFKNIEFSLRVDNSKKISNRNITVPDIRKLANSYDTNRYWFGHENSKDNSRELFAEYSNKFVFYSRGLDEQAIRDIFGPADVKVSWTKNGTDYIVRVFKLKDSMEFKN